MESLGLECTELKVAWENCFQKWYVQKFLKGSVEDDCKVLFDKYQTCLSHSLKAHKVDLLLMQQQEKSYK